MAIITKHGVEGKVCSTCREWKPLVDFSTDPSHGPTQGGRHCRFKACHRAKAKAVCVAIVVSGVLLAGCATTRNLAPPLPTSRTYPYSFDKVWGAVVSTMSNSYPIQTVDKSSGLITSPMVSLGSGFGGWQNLKQFAYEPKAFLATWAGGARYRVNLHAVGIGATITRVKISAHFEGFDDNASRSWHVWQSRGILESRMLSSFGSSLMATDPKEQGTIGVGLQHDGSVQSVAQGGPAASAGIIPGDKIIRVDNTPVDAGNLQDIVVKIRGELGTTVKLTVLRDGRELTFTLKREASQL